MVENHDTGEQAEVKITDRGPYTDKKRRVIDLSKAAADSIGLVESGGRAGTRRRHGRGRQPAEASRGSARL
jgi:rare lipoprotein A (peptidoglycan hydrolase)